MPNLTPRQHAVLDALRAYARAHGGRSPSLRELCRLAGLSSTSVARYTLDALAAQGYVTTGGYGEARGWRLVEDTDLLRACYEALPPGALREAVGERIGRG